MNNRHYVLAVAVMWLSLSFATAMAASADAFDVLGVHLGMTQTEVEASATAYDPQVHVVRKLTRFSYYDGWKSQPTEEFLETLRLEFPTKGGVLDIDFSPPPDRGRVVRIARTGGYSGRKVDFPPYEKFLQSLIGKYGEPVFERRRPVGGELLWVRPADGKVCLKTKTSLRLKVDEKNYDLSTPEDCARLLYYNLEPETPGGPVQRLRATAIDVAEIVRSELAAKAWLKKLSDDARSARAKATLENAPDL